MNEHDKPKTIGDALDIALGGSQHFMSNHCKDGYHRICLAYYGGRTCECDCHEGVEKP